MLGRNIDPMKEVLVTSGANGALSSFILALVNPGDEMIVFEPCFPMYLDHLEIADGVIKSVPLVETDGYWVLTQQPFDRLSRQKRSFSF